MTHLKNLQLLIFDNFVNFMSYLIKNYYMLKIHLRLLKIYDNLLYTQELKLKRFE